MQIQIIAKRGYLLGASILALVVSQQASAQEIASETVHVTGSRVISDAANSPTPLTIVSIEQLQATTPIDIPTGLNKLPIFQGSSTVGRPGDGSSNGASNVLNLRAFGAQRTLILLDGRRVPPSNSNGTVDTDTLPQMLVSRVDVVSGGASAVYGSDAVTGVVNFILDKKMTGVKADAQAGISRYGDGATYKIGLAAGTPLFNDRGHLEGMVELFHQDPVAAFARPYGPEVWVLTGSGTAANPFVRSKNVRRGDSAFGGKITSCTNPCSVLNQQFASNGIIGPFVPGQTTGTSNQNVGGDGAYSKYSTALSNFRRATAFARFSYDITPSTTFWMQGTAAEAFTSGWHFPVKLTPGSNQASLFFKNNPFLTAAAQAQLGNNGLSNSTNMFGLGTYFDIGQDANVGANNVNRNLSISAGLDGVWMDRFVWNLFYTHGENRLAVTNINNSNYQKQYAALDAVSVSGTIRCYAATQAATAAAYAGCVPMNAFGPTALTRDAFNWFTGETWFHQSNILDNVGGSISGPVFDLWAGPVTMAFSGEARWNDYLVTSNAAPTQTVDCTGLRICNASLPLWAQPVLAPVHATGNVWEVALEAQIPLLKDIPLIQNLSLNVAGRYTDYSTSGAVQTWKVGIEHMVDDQLKFRGTTSVDIRAPTLFDLFNPVSASVGGFVDLHTSTSNTVFTYSSGNPNLVPEVARTYTIGAVFTPEFIPNLTMSLDYFTITMKNAIGNVSGGNNDIKKLCEDSGGTSLYCALYERPLPFSDRTPANFPTKVFSRALNTALSIVEGFDFEANYRFDMVDLVSDWGGNWDLRLLATYQPTLESQAFTNAPITRTTGPKVRLSLFVNYQLNDWSFGLQDRWASGFSNVSATVPPFQVYDHPVQHSYNSVDLNVSKSFKLDGADLSAFATVENLFDAQADIAPPASSIGLSYPAPNATIMGRYYTIGVKLKL
ncbi:MAG TPA: TonB-dependent receptor [Rhizomicrobium sp.]|nr:TonB-dependent receptor [Rhizomicrobium sp.]